MQDEIQIKPIRFKSVPSSDFTLIAGPCSAESEKQVLATAHKLAALGISHFRAGLWKPRTKPGGFEGVGSQGLSWLLRVREETGMTVGTEVGTGKHARQAIESGVDMLWLGARTTSSPFAVSEIAEAIKGADIPVFVKNPINPDIELWVGAIQRLWQAGIHQIGAIHRGFSTYAESSYRNPPHWQIPIELRRRFPEITILGDPSHVAGLHSLVGTVARQMVQMHYSGLIIESHCKPQEALSDAAQQLTPEDLEHLLSTLNIPKEISQPVPTLEAWRTEIDEIDANIMGLISKRMKLSKKIGIYKGVNQLSVLQAPRYRELHAARLEEAHSLGLSRDFVGQLFSQIHEESINVQQKVQAASHYAVVSLGSNTNPEYHIDRAKHLLDETFFNNRVSPALFSKPIDFAYPSGPFLNCIASFQTEQSVEELSQTLKEIELAAGRKIQPKIHGRISIDIDLLYYDDRCLRPRDAMRPYVMAGLNALGLSAETKK